MGVNKRAQAFRLYIITELKVMDAQFSKDPYQTPSAELKALAQAHGVNLDRIQKDLDLRFKRKRRKVK